MTQGLTNVILLIPIFLFSLCLHEYAHAWMATVLGDPTPRNAGRLTLQPMAHADMVGTLILPSVCIYYGLPFFGWAKPVPIDGRHFRWARRDTALVAAAGPASNLLLALAAALVLGLTVRVNLNEVSLLSGFNLNDSVQILCLVGIQVNLFLALFNLIPLPPLDGFMILQAALPLKWVNVLYRVTPYTGIVLLALLLTGGLQYLAIPVTHLYRSLIYWVS